jgi:hypothetical protein
MRTHPTTTSMGQMSHVQYVCSSCSAAAGASAAPNALAFPRNLGLALTTTTILFSLPAGFEGAMYGHR